MFGAFFKISIFQLLIEAFTRTDLEFRESGERSSEKFSLLSLAGFVFIWLTFLTGRSVFLYSGTNRMRVDGDLIVDANVILYPYFVIALISTTIGIILFLAGVAHQKIFDSLEMVAATTILSGLLFLHNTLWSEPIQWMLENFISVSNCVVAFSSSCEAGSEFTQDISGVISHYMISLFYCFFGSFVLLFATWRHDQEFNDKIGEGVTALWQTSRGRRRLYFLTVLWLVSSAMFQIFIFTDIILTDKDVG